MSFNKQGGKDISLSVLGGLCSEMAPSALPEGVSPACQDVEFLPGSWSSRRGLAKYFATPFPAGGPNNRVPTVTYAKSFIDPLGVIENLYLDSNGVLWLENVTVAPGTYNQIGTVAPGSYAKSVTAFGREYIAVSDGLHGSDVPLQWDGTYLDKVTQGGPGAPPVVTSVTLPPVQMQISSSLPLTPFEADPATLVGGQFTQIRLWTVTSLAGVLVGQQVTITGYSGTAMPMNGTWTITALFPGSPRNLIQLAAILPATTTSSTVTSGITWAVATGFTMVRANNIVTVTTSVAHNLQPGFQAQITGIPAAIVGSAIASIVIDNEDSPGLATVTTADPHGLLPGCNVSLTGIQGVAVGTAITAAQWAGGLVTVTTSANHGLVPGANVTIAATGGGAAAFNGTFTVIDTPKPNTFTYVLTPLTAPADATGGSVTLNWPIPDAPTPTYFQAVTAPTALTFTVQITYCDSTFTSGSVSFAWDGTFFVLAVPATDVFQYQQYGPDATTNTAGEVTPYGQAAPGVHQCQVSFLTRNGYITAPSPPVTFVANGGQYLSLTQIPIAATNVVVARIIQFTGAGGSQYFYIPVPALENGQQVSTATQINDNTSTTALLDFGDNTLFDSEAVSIPGNTLQAQVPIEGALGFGFYASRIITWGQRNRIRNLLNMDFEGGFGFAKAGATFVPSPFAAPLGWQVPGALAGGNQMTSAHFGAAWLFSAAAGLQSELFQAAYLDAYGVPITTPNVAYTLRAWLKPSAAVAGVDLLAIFSSSSTGFSSTAEILGSAMTTAGGYVESPFNNPMPPTIPADLVFALIFQNTTGSGPDTLIVNQVSVLYAANPFNEVEFLGSYTNNPEAFDGVSGVFGSSEDTSKIMDVGGIIRETLYFLTQEPSGRLHQTSDNGVTEPVGWQVLQAAANCGVLSAFGVTRSQADDATASGGEEWFAWASSSGARIFGGDQPWKISQEIQPNWAAYVPLYQQTAWALNDPVNRVLYFGLATGAASAPALILQCSYRELDTAYQIATSGPIHTGLSGKLIATDHTRKWAPWNIKANGAALLYDGANQTQVILLGGNGQTPGAAAGFGNVYSLSIFKLSDDDGGQIPWLYTTYFFCTHEQEEALFAPNGAGRKLLQYVQAYVSGVGNLKLTFLCDRLGNPWALTVTRALSVNPNFDLECAGGNAQGQRIAIQFSGIPTAGTDTQISLARLTATMKIVTHLPVRGASA